MKSYIVCLYIWLLHNQHCVLAELENELPTAAAQRPNIVFILADDLGFNDVGFRGSAQIPTPNIDALAYSGLILNRYYVTPICTPSRSALMTGKYPIHLGMQHTVLYAAEARGLPLSEKLMPEYFNEYGYDSHIVGKWHLGHYKLDYTPTRRGFRSHVGFWTGHHDYYDHTAVEEGLWGLDMRNGTEVGYDYHGKYTTQLITDESVRIINQHNNTQPLFLYVAHAAVHSANPYQPLQAPVEAMKRVAHIEQLERRTYAAMVTELDASVGQIVKQLQIKNMLNNTIIVVSTDNGGPAEGFNDNHASNWPLRGVKNTNYEGGVRGMGVLWSPLIKQSSRLAEQTIHITDWLPTLLTAIGAEDALSTHPGNSLDGQSIWQALVADEPSPRKKILHNIDNIWGSSGLTVGDWKVVKGTNYKGAWDGWYGPAGVREARAYNVKQLYKCSAGKALKSLNMMPSEAVIHRLRATALVQCSAAMTYLRQGTECKPIQTPCLFNIKEDPCEQFNLAASYPEILNAVLAELQVFNASSLSPSNKPRDPKANPKFWQYTWTDFGDGAKCMCSA